MTDVLEKARTAIAAHDLVAPDAAVLLMVSGGSDSTALAYLGAALREAGDVGPVAMLHVNHQLRGDDADADERFVAADDDDRNAKQAREAWYGALVESGRMPAANIHAMPADTRGAEEIAAASPEQTDAVLAEAAAEYQRELIEQLGENPALDIAMFGMGPDAHFASLFPDHGEAEIDDPHVLVAGVRDSPKPPPLRLTLTVPMIVRSKHTWVFTSEERKAGAVKAAFAQRNNPHAPSSYADGEELLWLIDEGAASKL